MDPLTIAICTVACFILYNIIKVAVQLLKIGPLAEYASKSDGPQSMPIIGLAYLFIGSAEATMKKIIDIGKTYPPSFQTSLGKISIFATGIPEQLKIVLLSSKTIEKNEFYDFGRPWLGNGIFTAPASIWEVHRKLIQPSFNSMVVKSFVEIFSAQSVILAKKMERHLDGPEFEIDKYVSLCMLDVICGTAMGINLEAQTKENCEYGEATGKVIAGVTKRVLSPWLYPDFIFYRTRLGKDQQKNIKFLRGFVDNVIREKKEKIRQCTNQRESAGNKQDADKSSAHPEILIDNLIKLSNHNKIVTDEMVREQIDTIMVAGSDTSTIVGSFVILMLASQPDVQEKAYQELCDIFGRDAAFDDNGEPLVTSEILTKMTYMERVIKETMRLFPIGPLLFRKATDDLDLGNCTISKGSTVALNIIGVHRSEKYWRDPLKFDPDRFLPERFAEQEPFSYVPFSGGPRNCIGSKYAMMLIKTFTATILRRYVLAVDKVTPVEDVRLKMEFMMRPAVPIAIKIKRRT